MSRGPNSKSLRTTLPQPSTIEVIGATSPTPMLAQLVLSPKGIVITAGPFVWEFLRCTSRLGLPLGTGGDDLASRLARVIDERRANVLEFLADQPLDSMDDEFGIVNRDGEVELGCRIAVMRDGHIACVIQPTSTYRRFYRAGGETEGRLRQVQKMEALGQLAAGVAHDFNNLLTAIRGHVSLARTTLPKGHPAAENLDHVEQAAAQAAGVVNALMTFGGGTPGRHRAVSARAIVDAAAGMFRRALQPQIAFVCQVPTTGTLMTDADPHLIQQAILNLLINARDAIVTRIEEQRQSSVPAAQAPFGTITLKVDRVRAGGVPMVEICVKDDGAGIAQQHLARIFEPFFTTKPRGKGSGLGLSIVHAIVQEHGGSLTVASTLGAGTTFTMRLPASESVGADQSAEPSKVRAKRFNGRAVVAEPNQLVRGLLASMLESLGFEVAAVDNGAGALRLLGNEWPLSLLVMARALPDIDSMQLLQRARQVRGDVPCLILTSTQEKPETGQPGVEVLSKPFGLEEITDALSRLFVSSSMRSEPKPANHVSLGGGP